MITDIKVVLYEEKRVLSELLELLKSQFNMIINKELKELNNIGPKLEDKCKELANIEIKRRHFCGKDSNLEKIVKESKDLNLINIYSDIKINLDFIKEQHELNSNLLKKELLFTKKMINFIKPSDNKASTYNSYGKIGR